MKLYDRIAQSDTFAAQNQIRGIPPHTFVVALREYARGEMTRAEIIAGFALSAEETVGLDAILARIDAANNALAKLVIVQIIWDMCCLAQRRLKILTESDWNGRITRA